MAAAAPPPDYFTAPFINGLADDVRIAQAALAASDAQYARRTLVRAFFAAVEGITFAIKQTALRAHSEGATSFSAPELALLREEKYSLDREGVASSSSLFLRTEENVTFALTMAFRRYGQRHARPRSDPGWSAFRASLALRHRLTHPKALEDLTVTDEDLVHVEEALRWFDNVTDRLLDLELNRVKTLRLVFRAATERLESGDV